MRRANKMNNKNYDGLQLFFTGLLIFARYQRDSRQTSMSLVEHQRPFNGCNHISSCKNNNNYNKNHPTHTENERNSNPIHIKRAKKCFFSTCRCFFLFH